MPSRTDMPGSRPAANPTDVASRLHTALYPDAEVLFLAGSILRGEGTSTSDLDVVVLYRRLDCARRESFRFEGWPIEAFVHDPQTLAYFFRNVDRASGVPSLARMVSEGVALPGPTELSRDMKTLAQSCLHEGPAPWTQREVDASRYGLTNLLDDLVEPRSRGEQLATATALYPALANHFFRARGLWSAKDKSIPRRLGEVDPDLAGRFEAAFETIFAGGKADRLLALAEEVIEPDGGRLFEGYTLAAPESWRHEDPMTDPITLRPATAADAPVLADLMNAAGEGIPAHLWARMAEPGEDPMAVGARRVAREEGGFSYTHTHVAEVEGEIAGMLLGYRLPDPYDLGDLEDYPEVVRPLVELEALAPGAWYVNAIATTGKHRGRGVGTRLMGLAETLAKESGAEDVSLIVAEENDGARRLYERLGYQTVARRPITPYPGCPHRGDWILMRRKAAGAPVEALP